VVDKEKMPTNFKIINFEIGISKELFLFSNNNITGFWGSPKVGFTLPLGAFGESFPGSFLHPENHLF
jgi:hypothetical protein